MVRSANSVLTALLVAPVLGLLWQPVAPAAASDRSHVNGAIHVGEGEHAGNLSTVNGSIRVDDNAVIKNAKTVNGSIRVDDNVTAESLSSVNGAVKVGERCRINGDVRSVNGSLTLDEQVEVAGDLGNVNGRIEIDGARVNGRVSTVSGDIWIGADSYVGGGIRVEKPKGFAGNWDKSGIPQIVIGPRATVDGTLEFEREVKLYVSDTAKIGTVVGATPIKFSGKRP
jgi:cytoskeletal protein CcmA (bactofilin family)